MNINKKKYFTIIGSLILAACANKTDNIEVLDLGKPNNKVEQQSIPVSVPEIKVNNKITPKQVINLPNNKEIIDTPIIAKTSNNNVINNPYAACENTKFEVTRDSKGNPIYSKIKRGSYKANIYKVIKGDSLFFIAYITDTSVDYLIKKNNLKQPYKLSLNQKLIVRDGECGKKETAEPNVPNETVKVPVISTDVKPLITENKPEVEKPTDDKPIVIDDRPIVDSTTKQQISDSIKSNNGWVWPAKGQIISSFNPNNGGNRGIDIAGKLDDPVYSAFDGIVGYAGNALQGYGNLILIKHNNNTITAYAHNNKLLVKEGDKVKAGSLIAYMGSTGTNNVKLHFEIRIGGKAVDPLSKLPRNNK